MKGLLAIAGAVVSLSYVSVGHAAVIAGSAEDARGDVPLIVAEEHPRDLQSFEMRYDDDQGVLKGVITHWDPQLYLPGYSGYHWFGFRADVGVARSNGACDVTSTGGVRTVFRTPDDRPAQYDWAGATVVGGPEIAGEFSGTHDGPWSYTLTSPALVRRGYNCVTNIEATHDSSNTVDRAAPFCMGPTGTVACPGGPSIPAAPTGVSASLEGQNVTLTWNASADPNFSYFAIRRGTQPDPSAGTWTRLPGNLARPTVTDSPGPGTYYYYVTQINRAGLVSARSATVRVGIPAPATSDTGTTGTGTTGTPGGTGGSGSQPTQTPAGLTGPVIVVRGPNPVVAAPRSSPRQRAVSASQALRQARAALRLVHKTAFKKAKRFRATCRRDSATRRTCRVSWRYKRFRYSGRVRVQLRESGYSTTVSVKRSRVR